MEMKKFSNIDNYVIYFLTFTEGKRGYWPSLWLCVFVALLD